MNKTLTLFNVIFVGFSKKISQWSLTYSNIEKTFNNIAIFLQTNLTYQFTQVQYMVKVWRHLTMFFQLYILCLTPCLIFDSVAILLLTFCVSSFSRSYCFSLALPHSPLALLYVDIRQFLTYISAFCYRFSPFRDIQYLICPIEKWVSVHKTIGYHEWRSLVFIPLYSAFEMLNSPPYNTAFYKIKRKKAIDYNLY